MDTDAKKKLIDMLIQNGIWAVLFVGLLIYVLNQGQIREANLTGIVNKQQVIMSKQTVVLERLDERVCNIEKILEKETSK